MPFGSWYHTQVKIERRALERSLWRVRERRASDDKIIAPYKGCFLFLSELKSPKILSILKELLTSFEHVIQEGTVIIVKAANNGRSRLTPQFQPKDETHEIHFPRHFDNRECRVIPHIVPKETTFNRGDNSDCLGKVYRIGVGVPRTKSIESPVRFIPAKMRRLARALTSRTVARGGCYTCNQSL